MPIIADIVKRAVFFLFTDEKSAINNEKAGGTGFFVYMHTEAGNDYVYAVTNRHVIEKGSAFVIRVNNNEGGFDTIPLTLCDWVNHPNGADIAVAAIKINPEKHNYVPIPIQFFILPEHIEMKGVDIGDGVYMLGRFIHHSGRALNMPSARGGIISMLPDSSDLIPVDGMPDQEAYMVEMRSISGFSGSPTFLDNDMFDFMNKYQSIAKKVYNIENEKLNKLIKAEGMILLLGIDAGNFPLMEKVIDENNKVTSYKALSHSGFSIVIPAWKILEAVNCEEFVLQRKEDEKPKHREGSVRLDFSEDEKPNFAVNEFEEALKFASHKTFSPEKEKEEILE